MTIFISSVLAYFALCIVLTLKKSSANNLKLKTVEELNQLKLFKFRAHRLAKFNKAYGAMGHAAEFIVNINTELESRGQPVASIQSHLHIVENKDTSIIVYPEIIAAV
jgi:hypothetical protein